MASNQGAQQGKGGGSGKSSPATNDDADFYHQWMKEKKGKRKKQTLDYFPNSPKSVTGK